jgi:hypothetical protein
MFCIIHNFNQKLSRIKHMCRIAKVMIRESTARAASAAGTIMVRSSVLFLVYDLRV